MDEKNCIACNSNYCCDNIKKRLVVCCDGTGNAADKGTADAGTNVAKLSRSVAKVGITKDGEKIPQIVYYLSGVGTGNLTWVDKKRQGAVGEGLAERICEAYNFLASNYGPGDEIFIFGFSRGAYTARALASFICEVGMLTPNFMPSFFEIWEAYKNRKGMKFEETEWATSPTVLGELGTYPYKGATSPGTRIEHLQKCAHMHVTIKVVGVWDTVGSVTAFNWDKTMTKGADATYYNSKLHPKIEHAFHALALDESRGNFPPTLWYLDKACRAANVKLKQVWFPGYHSDVGGNSEGKWDTTSIDEIAFAWMVDQLYGLLQFSAHAIKKYVTSRIDGGFYTSDKAVKDIDHNFRPITWSDGVMAETNTPSWYMTSMASSMTPWYVRKPGETVVSKPGSDDLIDYKCFNEEIHPSVWHRIHNCKEQVYVPVPFRATGYLSSAVKLSDEWKHIDATKTSPATWVKNGKVVLNEYIIPKNDKPLSNDKLHPEDDLAIWEGSLERTFAPTEVLAAQDAI